VVFAARRLVARPKVIAVLTVATMSVLRRHLLLAAASTGLVLLGPPAARASDRVMYEGQSFERGVRVAGSELRLNGTGVRQVAWFKGYLAALYLPGPAASAAQAVAMGGPKRIHLRMLHEVQAIEFSKAVRKGVLRNVAASQHGALLDRLERFVRQIDALGKVRPKDVVDLDFEPGRGLTLYVNATLRGEPIPGEDFYAALLRSFVGDVPYDEKMRSGLLGRPA
jgi:Chalcone isomerase-like